jgi:hypothetical protein
MEREGIMSTGDQFHGGATMENNRFAVAGWVSILIAVLTLPSSFMHLMIDIKHIRWVLPFSAGLDIVMLGMTIFVLVNVREWLNKVYDFHDLDVIIPLIIAGNIVILPPVLAARIFDFGESYFYLIPVYAVVAVLSILMIVFSARFLRVEGRMRGLKKPIAYIGIAIAVCFLTFILIPLGMVLGLAYNLLIGLALLQSPSEEVDFV